MHASESRKLVAVLFADIVDYTALMHSNESLALARLEKFKNSIENQVVDYQGNIIQFYGDGCLCTFDSAFDAVKCAESLQQLLQQDPKVPVRIGINMGEVVYKDGNVFGDAVNIASRIESIGVAGAVLVAQKVQEQIENNEDFKWANLGPIEFKNIPKPIQVFALANDDFPIPNKKAIKGKLRTSTNKKPIWVTPLLTGIIALLIGFLWLTKQNASPITEELPSIAVLPFKDLSPNKDQEYFGDGIAEEILNTLAQLQEIKVAGRTSSFSFKDKESTIASIGESLKVNHILEGSVRKQKDKIRVTAQLVKVEDGFHVWSDKYDRELDDIFAIQDELAQNIGTVLLEKLAPEQQAKLQTFKPLTGEVYDLFLRAKHIHKNLYKSSLNLKDFRNSEQLFFEAISKDSSYALAHAGLADLYDSYWVQIQGQDGNSDRVKYAELMGQESKLALQLAPENAYVNQVRGYVLNHLGDTEAAFRHFLKSYRISPNNPESIIGLANLYLGMGLHEDALIFAQKAINIDPLFRSAWIMQIYANFYLSNWEKTITICQSFLDIDPNNQTALEYLFRAYFSLNQKEKALAILPQLEGVEKLGLDLEIALLKEDTNLINAYLAAGNLNVDFTIHSHQGATEKAEKAYQLATKEYLGYALAQTPIQSSYYLDNLNDKRLKAFQDLDWFQEVLDFEKGKYDYLTSKYPRAAAILGQ